MSSHFRLGARFSVEEQAGGRHDQEHREKECADESGAFRHAADAIQPRDDGNTNKSICVVEHLVA